QQAPCLFLQGASGELAPAEQYTGDTAVADRHGTRVGYAALSALEAMGPAGKGLTYDRTVESGAPLAVWSWRDAPVSMTLAAEFRTVDLPLKEMPTVAELDEQIARCTDRVLRERLGRRRAIRTVVGEGRSSPV